MRRRLLGRLELRVKCSARSILLVDIIGRDCSEICEGNVLETESS